MVSEDVVVVAALLTAEGLIETAENNGLRVTPKGYAKGYELWMAMSGEDRLLIVFFLRAVKLV